MDDLNYPIVIYPCDEGGFATEVPALKGCLVQGETLTETLEELAIVKQLWLETAQKQGENLPNVNHALERVKADPCLGVFPRLEKNQNPRCIVSKSHIVHLN